MRTLCEIQTAPDQVKRLLLAFDAALPGLACDHAPFDYVDPRTGRLEHDAANCPRCRYKAARTALSEWANQQRIEQWSDRQWPFRDLDYGRRAAIRDADRALKKYPRH